MTVAELVELLKAQPQDYEVEVSFDSNMPFNSADHVETSDVTKTGFIASFMVRTVDKPLNTFYLVSGDKLEVTLTRP